jgi:hypothetical protein
MWSVAGTDEFDEWYALAGDDLQAEVIAKVALLRSFGPRLRRPHADTLNGSKHAHMKELRVDTRDAVVRIAFAFDPERSAIILCAADKSGVGQKQFYKRLIDRADKLYDEHLEMLKNRKKSRKE